MFFTTFLALAFWCRSTLGITVTSSTSSYTVDTESSDGFSVAVSRTSCDITSVVYDGTDYQYAGTGSQIASGLGTATVSYTTTGDYVVVKCVADNADFDLTHYMVFKDGDASIYMGTHTVSEPGIGELRFIFRLTGLTDMYPAYSSYGNVADTEGGSSVEGSDVFLVSGQTRSKFYSSNRFIDDTTYCATNSAIHACWLRPGIGSVEKSSGGPFVRDIDVNWRGDYSSLTYYMNSNHLKTEEFRQGFHGPYVFTMTDSGIPSASSHDVSFFDDIASDLEGYVPTSARGYVAGKASGTDASKEIVLHWHNADYQGWVYASASGDFTGPLLPTGTYTMKLYQGELLAASQSVTIKTGKVTSNIAATNPIITENNRTKIFQLGEYDGQPLGFLNADKQLRMHPSDTRMSSWTPGSIEATASTATAQFPMALFKANGAQTLTFSLPSALNEVSYFRTATTLSFASGRPLVVVNNYSCGTPASPAKIDSRGVTRGAYRGWGDVYNCTIPAGTLKAGTNTISISIESGSSGDAFLSPSVIFDALELYY